MTTIATDGKTMAADGRSVMGSLIVSETVEKLAIAKDGSIVGCAGDRACCRKVLDWFVAGEDRETIPTFVRAATSDETLFDCLVLRPDGRVEFMDEEFILAEHTVPTAQGSGGEVALGLMVAGKSPREAVEIVATMFADVGGTIVELKPGKPRK